eukprot:gene579-8089_t
MGNDIGIPLNPSHEDSRYESNKSRNNKKLKRRRSNSLNSRSLGNQKTNGLHSSRYVSFIVKESSYVAVGLDEDGNKTINEYTILSTLGSGAFAKVKLCMNSTNDKPFAVKIINKSLLKSKIVSSGVNALDLARRECLILKKLHHPNIVKLIEVIDDPENNKMFFVMEYVENGPVWKQGSPPFEEEVARKYTIDILEGLHYLHRKNIIHRDIKPENLLLDHNNVVKLSDFGVSEILQEEDDTINKYAGTPAFQSPESIEGGGFSGKAADIWAVGVTLFLFIFGELPFKGKNHSEIWNAIQNKELQLPHDIPEDMKDFLIRLLKKDANERIKMHDIRKHPWIDPDGKNADEEEEVWKPPEEKSAYTRVQQKLISLRNKQIKGKSTTSSQTEYLTKSPRDVKEPEAENKEEEELFEEEEEELKPGEEVDIFAFLKTQIDAQELQIVNKRLSKRKEELEAANKRSSKRKSSREENIDTGSPKRDSPKTIAEKKKHQSKSTSSPTFSSNEESGTSSTGILSALFSRRSTTSTTSEKTPTSATNSTNAPNTSFTKSVEQEIMEAHKNLFDDLTETIDEDSGDVDEMTDYLYSVEDETHASPGDKTPDPDNDINLLLKRQNSMFVLTNDEEDVEDQLEWRQYLKFSPRGNNSFKKKRELMEIKLNEKLGSEETKKTNTKPPVPPKAIKDKNGNIKPAPPLSPKPKLKTHSLVVPPIPKQPEKEEMNVFDLDQTREPLQILLSTKKFQESFAHIEDPKERQLEISKFLSGQTTARTLQTKKVLNTLEAVSRQSMDRAKSEELQKQIKEQQPKKTDEELDWRDFLKASPEKKQEIEEEKKQEEEDKEEELEWRDFIKAHRPKRRSASIPPPTSTSLSESPETEPITSPTSTTHALIKKIISPRPKTSKTRNNTEISEMPPPSKPIQQESNTTSSSDNKPSPRTTADFFQKNIQTTTGHPPVKRNSSTDHSIEQSPFNTFFSIFKKKSSVDETENKKPKTTSDGSKKSDEDPLTSPATSLKSPTTIKSNQIQFPTNRAVSMSDDTSSSIKKLNSFSNLNTMDSEEEDDSDSINSDKVEAFNDYTTEITVENIQNEIIKIGP